MKQKKMQEDKHEGKLKRKQRTRDDADKKLQQLFSKQNVEASKRVNELQHLVIEKEQQKYAQAHAIKQETQRSFDDKVQTRKDRHKKFDNEENGQDATKQESKAKPTDRNKQRENLKKKKARKLAENRTIFVGNIPLMWTKKELRKLFKNFGEIESVRIRCPPPADPKVPKKVVVIRKDFHSERKNLLAFVVFKEESSVEKALSLNGKVIEDHHIRVDCVSEKKEHDHSHSVFVGNLPFNVNEEQLRGHFSECGQIRNIRIIRDNKTSVGKGFGYVLFESKDGVSLALNLHESEFEGRQLRVFRSQQDPKSNQLSDKRNKTRKLVKTKEDREKLIERESKSAKSKKNDKRQHEGKRKNKEKSCNTQELKPMPFEMKEKLKKKREKKKKNFSKPKLQKRKFRKMFNS